MEPGTPIRCEMTKWGDLPHWQFAGVRLGTDAVSYTHLTLPTIYSV